MDKKQVLRPAGNMETMVLALMEQHETPNPFFVSEIEGPVTLSALQTIIKALQERNPLLYVHAEKKGEEYLFVKGSKSIEIQLVERQAWQDLIEEQINSCFIQQEGPLLRAFLVPGAATTNYFITVSHHSICDGASLQEFHYQVLRQLHNLFAGKEIDLPRYTHSPALDEFLQIQYQAAGPQAANDIFKEEQDVSVSERKTQVVFKELEPAAFSHLKQRCKEHNISVHGAICAAQIMAAAEVISKQQDKQEVHVRCGTWFDYRPHVNPPLERGQMIFYSGPAAGGGSYVYTIDCENPTPFWTLAKQTRDDLVADFDNGSMLAQPSGEQMKEVVRKVRKGELAEYYSYATVMISNLGAEHYQKEWPPFKWLSYRCGFGMVKNCPPVITSAINGFDDKLYASFMYVAPEISETTAQLFADKFLKYLGNNAAAI